jgi:hypothetical protein
MKFKANVLVETRFNPMNDRAYEEQKIIYIDAIDANEVRTILSEELSMARIIDITIADVNI